MIETFFAIYLVCTLAAFVAFYFWVRIDKTAYSQAKVELQRLNSKINLIESVLNANIGSTTTSNKKVQYCEEKVIEFAKDIEAAQDHMARLREQQIRIMEKLARKKPQPIQVQFVTEAKSLAKQLKGFEK